MSQILFWLARGRSRHERASLLYTTGGGIMDRSGMHADDVGTVVLDEALVFCSGE